MAINGTVDNRSLLTSLPPVSVREARLLNDPPWVRTLGKLTLEVTTEGWRFPTPPESNLARPGLATRTQNCSETQPKMPHVTRLRIPADTVLIKERLLYLLQPPLKNLFAGRQAQLPFQPYPYQLEGIAFLMPRHDALLADEMGLGKTMQTILAMRLLFQAGLIRRRCSFVPRPWSTTGAGN